MRHDLKKSFTLLETLVAIYVLLVGIVGAMTLTQQNLASGSVFRNQLIAANLAQEGIELVRNRRDSNYLCYSGSRFDVGDGEYCNDVGDDCNEHDMEGILDETPAGACFPPSGAKICAEPYGCRTKEGYSPSDNFVEFQQCTNSSCRLAWNSGTNQFEYSPDGIFERKIIITELAAPTGGWQSARKDWEVRSIVTLPGRFGARSIEERVILTPWLN